MGISVTVLIKNKKARDWVPGLRSPFRMVQMMSSITDGEIWARGPEGSWYNNMRTEGLAWTFGLSI